MSVNISTGLISVSFPFRNLSR